MLIFINFNIIIIYYWYYYYYYDLFLLISMLIVILIFNIVFIVCFVACLIGLIVDRYILLKFFLCYETFFFTISVIMLIYSVDINVMILVFYLLSLSAFEVILGLSILLLI